MPGPFNLNSPYGTSQSPSGNHPAERSRSLSSEAPHKLPDAPQSPPFALPPLPLGGGGLSDRSTPMSVTMSWQLFSILCIARATASSSSPSSSPSGPPGDPPTGMYRASSAAFASPSLTPKNVLISASLSAVAIMPKYSSLTSSLVIVQNS